jgi:anhydro-N-acetylmuramic acid kinase
MSGTSIDAIDAVLLEITDSSMQVRASSRHIWPESLLSRLQKLVEAPQLANIDELGALDTAVALEFAAAAEALLLASATQRAAIRAVGSHGQTVRHRPRDALPFTMQIGDPNLIAERLQIDVVADFRRRDIAAGGEGAPLVPAFHAAAFGRPGENRVIVNIGGIANVSLIAAEGRVTGFDTGPGNCLMDGWTRRWRGEPFDRDGAWGASGEVNIELLQNMLEEPYFQRAAPKSTGRELFNASWLGKQVRGMQVSAVNVQATLTELTARTIASALPDSGAGRRLALLCGGGAHNKLLLNRLSSLAPDWTVETTASHGIAVEQVEAATFAWLAHRHLSGLPGNLPAVTGARHPVVLGALFPGGAHP